MKKLLLRSLILATAGSLMVIGGATATPLNANGMQLGELQNAFSGANSTSNANTDESGSELFAFQTSGATATYVATVSYTASSLLFGFYDKADTSNTLLLFDSATQTVGSNTQIYIDLNSFNLASFTMDLSDPLNPVTNTIDTATFATNNFGFYMTTTYGTYFSESDLNATGTADLDGDGNNDNDHFLTYEGKGDTVTWPGLPGVNDYAHWYVAAEGTPINGLSDDFTDFIAQIESIQPVPEPATMLLFGAGLIGLAGVSARRKKK